MTVTEQLLAAVEASGADAGKKAVVEEFLKEAGPVIEALGPSVFQQLMNSAAGGAIPPEVIDNLDAGQVAALLAQADEDLSALADKHGAQVAAWNAALAQLETVALAALARVLIGVL